MTFVFDPEATVSLPVYDSQQRYPVRRIYCVGRNYSEHVKEMALSMGKAAPNEPPCFFTKPANAIVSDGQAAHYPTRTQNLHHEVELVIAIGKGGSNIAVADSWTHVFGFAVGLDLTRRDLQTASKKAGQPWDTGKAFDDSAPISAVRRLQQTGRLESGRIWLEVNGEIRQDSNIDQQIWSIPEIIAELSTFFSLQPGDLIFTGTPAGVSAVQRGNILQGGIDGVARLRVEIV